MILNDGEVIELLQVISLNLHKTDELIVRF